MRVRLFFIIWVILLTINSYGYESGGIRYHYEQSGGVSFIKNPKLIADSVTAPATSMEIIERVLTGYDAQNAPNFAYVKSVIPGIFDDCTEIQTLKFDTNSSFFTCDSPGFKGCINLSTIYAGKWSGLSNSGKGLYRGITLWAFPPKPCESYSIASGTTTIGVRALAYCSISELRVPSSVSSFKSDALKEFKGKISFEGTYDSYEFLSDINPKSTIELADPSELPKVRQYFSGDIDGLIKLNLINYSYNFLIFNITASDLLPSDAIQSIKVGDLSVTPNNENSDFPNWCKVDNLEPDTDYAIVIKYLDDNYKERTFTQTLRTKAISTQDIEVTLMTSYFGGFDFNLSKTIEDLKPDEYEYGMCVNENQYIPFGDSKLITIGGLKPNTHYNVKPYIKFYNKYYYGNNQYISTKDVSINIGYNSYQTAIYFNGKNTVSKDKTFSPSSISIWFNSECTLTSTWLTNLRPNTSYTVYAKVVYDNKFFVRQIEVKTRSINLNILGEVGPTTLYCWYTYDKPEDYAADIDRFIWNDIDGGGRYLEQKGLKPSTSYTIKISAILKDGTRIDTKKTFKTTSLSLEILPPKIPNDSRALAYASTNISYLEDHAGFQWKKYDAPSSLEPSEGYACIYEGSLQGVINNLQSNHYYNIRAFYKDNDGKYYYTDWKTFDPSDVSWLEPTVHTYNAENITNNSALLRGYVLSGSSDITSQGFEYWSKNTPNNIRRKNAYTMSEECKQTILSNGQMMIAELSSLQSGTNYIVRTFVTTNEGTFYGEEIEFTTEGVAGIRDIEKNANEIIPVAYYNLYGYSSIVPFKGVNIVIMNDGSTRKIIFR